MRLVVDANILFSFFNRKSTARDLILSGKMTLYSPEFILKEIEKYKGEIMDKFSLTETQYLVVLNIAREFIVFVPISGFIDKIREVAEASPDPKDVQYLALAMKYGIPIWSNDKRLKEQSIVTVFSTEELIRFIE
jgi:predicted nucleic acid-binding protein